MKMDFENGQNVILLSPRRMGKTSLVQKVMREGGGSDDESLSSELVKPANSSKAETSEERAARLKAEEEAKRKAEERRQKEEELRKKEAEEKRKREEAEKQRLEDEKEAYRRAYAEWETECSKVNEQRSAYIAEQLENEKTALKAAAEETKRNALENANSKLDDLAMRKKNAEKALEALGVFKFGEKKTQKALIEQCEAEIRHTQEKIAAAKQKYDDEMNGMDRLLKQKKKSYTEKAEKLFVMPHEPQKPDSVIKEEEEQERQRAASMLANQSVKEDILAFMADGGLYTVTEIAENFPEFSNTRISALLRQLLADGKVERLEDKRKAYFRIIY